MRSSAVRESILVVPSAAVAAACWLAARGGDPFLRMAAGAAALAGAVALAPGAGRGGGRWVQLSLLTAGAVQAGGGWDGFMTPLYFVLLGFMALPRAGGPALETGTALGVAEAVLGFLSSTPGDPLLERLGGSLRPLVSLPLSALLLEWASEALEPARPVREAGGGEIEGLPLPALVEAVSSARTLGAAMHPAAAWLRGGDPAVTVTVGLLSGDGSSLDVYESAGPLSEGRVGGCFPLDGTVAGWTISSSAAVFRTGLLDGSAPVLTLSASDPSRGRSGSCATSPLFSGEKCVGLIMLEGGDSMDPAAAGALPVVSRLLGMAIEKVLLLESRRELRSRDSLTGLPRLTDLMDSVRAGARDVQRYGRSVTLFVIGVEDLSRVNASSGFRAGDDLLRTFARRLEDLCGAEARPARLGGARFAVFAGGMDHPAAEAWAESLVRISSEPAAGYPGLCVAVGGATTRTDRRVDSLLEAASAAYRKARSSPSRAGVVLLQPLPSK